jgi:putative ABC transport system permease protein
MAVVGREAGRTLARNKLRSGLSVLGIAVGIAAVICVVALGEASSAQLQQQMRDLGSNMVWIEAGAARTGGIARGAQSRRSLSAADAFAIQRSIPLFRRITPNVDFGEQVVYGNENWGTTIRGVYPQFFRIRDFNFDLGGSFTLSDVTHANNVCVLGATVAEQLFPGGADPVGKTIRIKNLPFTVVGTLRGKGQSVTGQDQDDLVVIPYTTAQEKLLGEDWADDIFANVVSRAAMPAAEQEAAILLRSRHRIPPGQPDDFKIQHAEAPVEAAMATNRTMEFVLVSLGGISLLVGGIGIMNVMLASVTERTREIGIRMAVGATEREVEAQFLGEAILLSLCGAGLGTLIGAAGGWLLGSVTGGALPLPAAGVALAVVSSSVRGGSGTSRAKIA